MLESILNNKEFFIFVLFLSIFLIIKRKNLALQGSFPILYILMYRTKLGLDKMKVWSEKYPKTYLYLAYLCLFIGIVGMVFTLGFMIWQLSFIIDNELSTGGGLVLPIKTEAGLDSAVPVFYVPFWYWIIALFILATVHEFAHGVIAERFKIRI
jgi:sterol desaturase/sphingolipid hydroxylase (fatty acid hydroxylase superfamily)